MKSSLLIWVSLASLSGCFDGIRTGATDIANEDAGRPQSLVFIDENTLAVGLTHFDGEAYGAGELVILDPMTGQSKTRLQTTALNPQSLILHQNQLVVVESGQIDLSDPEHPTAQTEGAIEVWPIDAFSKPNPGDQRKSLVFNAEGSPFVPIGAAVTEDRGLVTSAIKNEIAPISLDPLRFLSDPAPTLPLDPQPRIGLGSAISWENLFILADFNVDRLYFLDVSGQTICQMQLGESARDIEGPQALATIGDQLFVLMTLSGSLISIDLSPIKNEMRPESCDFLQGTRLVSNVGLTPNHLISNDNLLFVVDSGTNRVIAYDPTGAEKERYVLDVNANPWHAAISPSGRYLAVSEWAADAISLFDRQSGQRVARHLFSQVQPQKIEPSGGFEGEGELAYADLVVDAPGASGARFHDPQAAVNGVRGAGMMAGSLDVFSLSATGPEASITLAWSDRRLIDGEGPDLAVFENAFNGPSGWYIEPIIVEFSIDGTEFIAFPHDYLAPDETLYEPKPELWSGFAGINSVSLHEEQNPVDPFSSEAGGNSFDLAELPDTPLGIRIKKEGARYVRLTAASAVINPDTGREFPIDPDGLGPDIDGIYGRVLP